MFTGFFEDLTYWPRFWPDMTHIRTWLIYCQDDYSEQVLWWLNQNCGLYSAHNVFLLFYLLTLFFDPTSPILEHNWDIVTMIILSKFDEDWTKTVASIVFTMFLHDLNYWPSFWPIFELDRDIVKMIILSKFHYDWTKTVASRVFTMFFYDLTYWLCFWPDMTHIRTWPRYFQDNHSEQVWWWLD